jgi:hypothetical protein
MATELKRSDSMDRIAELLGPNASTLLDHTSQTISKDHVQLPGPDFVDRVWGISDRPAGVLRSLQTLFDNGRLRGTGYLSILPVDQGIEHSAGASFAPNPQYFDPENIIKLAIEGGFLLDHGMIDAIIDRRELRNQIIKLLNFMMNPEIHGESDIERARRRAASRS